MANKKQATKTKKVEENIVEKEIVKEEKTQVKKKEISRDMLVPCRNITSGRLIYVSKKTGIETIWSEYGDVEYLDVAELLTMRASQPKFLKEPWLFIEDEDVVEYLKLQDVYKNIIPVDEVDEFFKLSAKEAKKVLVKLPKGMKELLIEKARKGLQEGTINNLQLIRVLEKELDINLLELMDE